MLLSRGRHRWQSRAILAGETAIASERFACAGIEGQDLAVGPGDEQESGLAGLVSAGPLLGRNDRVRRCLRPGAILHGAVGIEHGERFRSMPGTEGGGRMHAATREQITQIIRSVSGHAAAVIRNIESLVLATGNARNDIRRHYPQARSLV